MLQNFNENLKAKFNTVATATYDDLFSQYCKQSLLRKLWGTPYHYVSFVKRT